WDSNFSSVYHMANDAANTTVTDSTSNANSGTNQANTSSKTATGEINGALSYNGSSDYTLVSGSSSLNITGNVTISAWVKTSDTIDEQAIFDGYNSSGSPYAGYG